mmetsp:Transcript_9089/g.19492  ORF Transcript_9089/g.19492 Transcript_9089/m.19492 type:complete len:83 (+) Transcript_9089:2243-2491(+)
MSRTVPSPLINSTGPPLPSVVWESLGLNVGPSIHTAPWCRKIALKFSHMRSTTLGSAPSMPSAEPEMAAEAAAIAAIADTVR